MAKTITGNTGKTYTYNSDGSITTNRPDGTSSTVRQGDALWNATNNAIAADTPKAVSVQTYVDNLSSRLGQGSTASTPKNWTMDELRNPNSGAATPTNYNTPGAYKDADGNWVTSTSMQRTYTTDGNGNTVLDPTKTDSWTQRAYLQDNKDLQYAMSQYGTGKSVNDYVKSLYDRIGTERSDGTRVTREDVYNELNRLGLSDFDENHVIYTAGGNYLPGGSAAQYGRESYGDEGIMVNGSPQGGRYYTYGGQTYLMNSNGQGINDAANLSQFANLMTGKSGVGDIMFGGMGNNTMIAGDPNAQQAMMNLYGQYAPYLQAPGSGNQGTLGNGSTSTNVNDTLNYFNSVINYGNATGNTSLMGNIADMLKAALTASQDFIASQKTQASDQATAQARSAWINKQLNQKAMANSMSSSGYGTSGATISAMQGIENEYGKNLNDINTNLNTMLSSLSQQELQALASYYDKLTDYQYKITSDQQQMALDREKMAIDQQQWRDDYALRQQQNAQQQAQYDLQNQRSQEETEYKRAYDIRLEKAQQLNNALNAGVISTKAWTNGMKEIGFM